MKHWLILLGVAVGCSSGGPATERVLTGGGGGGSAGGAPDAGVDASATGAAGQPGTGGTAGQPGAGGSAGSMATAGTGGGAAGGAGGAATAGTGGGAAGAAGATATGGTAGTAGGTAGMAGATATGGMAGMAGAMATGGTAGTPGTGGTPVFTPPPCSDLFAQTLQTFSIDISADDWNAIQTEFITVGQLPDEMFVQYDPAYYPVVFHYGNETVSDAYIRLKGDSSWREAVAYDGTNGKMQVVISFDHIDSKADFHGASKIGFDMPRTDPTFMRDRIANMWLRSIGVPAICSTNAVLMVNGSLYGLFVAEERISHHFVKEWFPDNSDGDLFKGGWTPETNESSPNWTRLDQFWAAMTPAQMGAIVDVGPSLLSWAAEAMLNDADGYYGGDHNFFIYDQGAKGYVFFPEDLDSSLDYLGQFTSDPIAWWSTRNDVPDVPPHYLIMMGDDALRAQYIGALATQLGNWNIPQIQSWIDTAAAQIAPVVPTDPHKPSTTTLDTFQAAVALARHGIQDRADYVSSWLACRASGTGPDKDGDGVIWCMDCRDDDATIHPGAAEICGNHIDENCNGLFDEGCP